MNTFSTVDTLHNSMELNNITNTLARNEKYPDVKETEYLDLCMSEDLHAAALLPILKDLSEDTQLKQIDLSYIITQEEAYQPKRMANLCEGLKKFIRKTQTCIALDLVGNHLGMYGPHPLNEQKYDIPLEIAKALTSSKITRLDISDNQLTGAHGSKLTALGHYSRNFIHHDGRYFLSRSNNLQSQALVMIANGCGHDSKIEYLDLNDNRVGMDPAGHRNSEGMLRFAYQLPHTLHLRVLKLARNSLGDEDIEHLCDALTHVSTLQVLDLAGNYCQGIGMEFVAEMILSHAVLDLSRGLGIRDLDISLNPIGPLGVKYLCPAVERSESLEALSIAGCNIDTDSMYKFHTSIQKNAFIGRLDVSRNPCDGLSEEYAASEGVANASLVKIREDIHSIDTRKLSKFQYTALKNKLKYLSKDVLYKLHKNPSFNQELSKMKEELHVLAPPSRKFYLKEVIAKDSNYQSRLHASSIKDKEVMITRKIYHIIMKWWTKVQARKKSQAALLEQRRRQAEEEREQLELLGFNS